MADMDRRGFLVLFASAGISAALAGKAFSVAQFIDGDAELQQLVRRIRATTFGSRLPDAIRLPAAVWDEVAKAIYACRQFTNPDFHDAGIVNLYVGGVPIIRGDDG